MPGGAVAMAEGNAMGKGPVIFHLFDSGIELIRRKAAGQKPSMVYSTHLKHTTYPEDCSSTSGCNASIHITVLTQHPAHDCEICHDQCRPSLHVHAATCDLKCMHSYKHVATA